MKNQHRINQYKTVRAIHLVLISLTVPLALYYLTKFDVRVMDGGPYNFIASLYSLAVLLYLEQYYYPLNLGAALHRLIAFALTFISALVISGNDFFYVFYELFYAIICLQAVLIILLAIVLPFNYRIKISSLSIKRDSIKNNFLIFATLLLVGSPLILAPWYLSTPFIQKIKELNSVEQYLIITSLGYMVCSYLFQIIQSLFSTSPNKAQEKLINDWSPYINMLFFLALLAVFVIMFL